jgi:hypothetical protein
MFELNWSLKALEIENVVKVVYQSVGWALILVSCHQPDDFANHLSFDAHRFSRASLICPIFGASF